MGNHGFAVVVHGFDVVVHGFDVVVHGFDVVVHGFDVGLTVCAWLDHVFSGKKRIKCVIRRWARVLGKWGRQP